LSPKLHLGVERTGKNAEPFFALTPDQLAYAW
jgi:hypothetical protein